MACLMPIVRLPVPTGLFRVWEIPCNERNMNIACVMVGLSDAYCLFACTNGTL